MRGTKPDMVFFYCFTGDIDNINLMYIMDIYYIYAAISATSLAECSAAAFSKRG